MTADTVICLCDLTGHFGEPWAAAGFHVVLVDPQHPAGVSYASRVTRIGAVIIDAMGTLGPLVRKGRVAFVAGFPPCTDLSLSGTRWWAAKAKADRYFQAKAAMVVEQCRMLGMVSGAPWVFENPMSALSKIAGPPQHKFHPWQYTTHCADDNYRKETWLWSGGGFVMPIHAADTSLGEPDERIHKAPPGDGRQNFRSATPLGFSRAVFAANAPATSMRVASSPTTEVA